ncbi:ComF family protein [Marinomonas algarum]|uniref:ComF family protein n=1 Tax=Marinomonas algarum TaxID=2883105 RepID=A0A9X1LCZ4_9GAMM|nr:phosphoribosyltransferase family protein [Marinomonas algarum]MCB5161952.1 ComF family protein [Marinomonas algarum]
MTNQKDTICLHCTLFPPPYKACIAPFRFEGITKTLIHHIKFHQGNHYIRPLTYLLSQHLHQHYENRAWPEQLIYIPSHPKRIKERGFCQTRTMSAQLIKQLRQTLGDHSPTLAVPNPLSKIQHSQAQHSLSRTHRLDAPQSVYSVQGRVAKHVALFDDVMTTGSTIENATRLLQQAGAEQVDVWVIARTADKQD